MFAIPRGVAKPICHFPIDKASGNIAFVCKRFYAQVLVKELGSDGLAGSATYEKLLVPPWRKL